MRINLSIEEMQIIFAAMDDYIQSEDDEVRRISESIVSKLQITDRRKKE